MIRNKEFFFEIALSCCILILFTVAACVYPSVILLPASCLLIILNHLIYTKLRYLRIKRLSQEITNVLHGYSPSPSVPLTEGELSVLETEINKMMRRLSENAESLNADKRFLSEAVSDISHQLRTPLTSVNLMLSMLSSEEITAEKRLKLTHELMRSMRRIDWLIESLLKMSRLDAGTVIFSESVISVKDVFAEAVAPLEIFLELRALTIEAQIGDESFTGDLYWTAEAVSNLIKNCAQHTPPGGVISVSAGETPLFTEITVSDTGNGFDERDLPHLFERFYKGSNASEDSIGIGLALSKNIITRQEDVIRAVNTEKGAAFIIRFYKTAV